MAAFASNDAWLLTCTIKPAGSHFFSSPAAGAAKQEGMGSGGLGRAGAGLFLLFLLGFDPPLGSQEEGFVDIEVGPRKALIRLEGPKPRLGRGG